MMREEDIQIAMSIILHAGEARTACKEALDGVAEMDFDKAQERLKEAVAKITLAHKIQTDAIQGEARGEQKEYSLLFAHAQDTLMTIYSEINITKQMVKIFKSYTEKFEILKQEDIT